MTKSIPTTANKSNDNTALKDTDRNKAENRPLQRGETEGMHSQHSIREDESRPSERSDGSRRTPQKTTQS